MKIFLLVIASSFFLTANPALAAGFKSPEENFKAYPNRLADIPPGWSTSNPIRQQVLFNLRYPPNSPEANAFLLNLYRSIKAMPYGVEVKVERVVLPSQFAYALTLNFKNWENNRAYESSAVFLKYYREQWKPAVTETAEQMTILDMVATSP